MNCQLCGATPCRCDCATPDGLRSQAQNTDETLTDRELTLIQQGWVIARMAAELWMRGFAPTQEKACRLAAEFLGEANTLVDELNKKGD